MTELTLTQHEKFSRRTADSDTIASPNTSMKLKDLRLELDEYYSEMLRFRDMEPDEIFMRLSAYSARASYIRSDIMRAQNRTLTAFRTGEIDPFLTECDRQFKVWSRVFAVTSLDWNLARGQT